MTNLLVALIIAVPLVTAWLLNSKSHKASQNGQAGRVISNALGLAGSLSASALQRQLHRNRFA